VDDRSGHGLLDIRDLDQLKEKLVVALSGYLVAGHGGNGRWQQSPRASVDEAGRKSTEA
jgi:hypothetical protein